MSSRKSWKAGFLLGLAAFTGTASAADPQSMVIIERFNAERGDANSQYFMGEHYEFGNSGLRKDLGKALEWYRKAAERNSAAAQFKIGQFYERGLGGLTADPAKAEQWYRQAADHGNRPAQQRLTELAEERKRTEEKRKAERNASSGRRRHGNVSRRPGQPAAKKPSRPSLDATALLKHVADRKWYKADQSPAEFLPATDMNCLKTAEREITCFSKERKRTIEDKELTFSLKSVLQDFSGNQGFNVNYIYNVTEIRTVPTRAATGDDYGLTIKKGWQPPGRKAHCRLKALNELECSGAHVKPVEYSGR